MDHPQTGFVSIVQSFFGQLALSIPVLSFCRRCVPGLGGTLDDVAVQVNQSGREHQSPPVK